MTRMRLVEGSRAGCHHNRSTAKRILGAKPTRGILPGHRRTASLYGNGPASRGGSRTFLPGSGQELQGEGQPLDPSSRFGPDRDGTFHILWEDGDRVFCQGWHWDAEGNRDAVLTVVPAAEHPTPASLDRLAREYGLKHELDGEWAARPLALVHDRPMLVLEDPGGELLDRLLDTSMEMGRFLRLATGIVTALRKAHRRGLVHKDLKPANILVNRTTGEVKLTGFGIASRLPRERQAPEPPESIAGTLAYMAPEQTGRMSRSIDTRSDLYAFGITLYQMLTGTCRLPQLIPWSGYTATSPLTAWSFRISG